MNFKPWMMKYRDAAGDDGVDASGTDTGGTDTDVVADAGGDDTTQTKGNWPENWRELISSDEKHIKTLNRFGSPKAMYDSYMALRQRMDSGEIKPNVPFPSKGTPEEQTAWRKTNSLPEKPEDYAAKFDTGLVVGEADKEGVDAFLKSAHAMNLPSEQVNGILHWYYERQEAQIDAIETRDAELLSNTEDMLRSEWGGEYRRNINMIKGLVETAPENVRDLFIGARLADGNALLNHPDMARWLVDLSRQINPITTVVPGAGANVASAIEDEIAAGEKLMRTDRAAYNRDQKLQARMRELYSARDRAKK